MVYMDRSIRQTVLGAHYPFSNDLGGGYEPLRDLGAGFEVWRVSTGSYHPGLTNYRE